MKKYSHDQLELIAIMFKIQHGEKTVGDIFPDYREPNQLKIKISEIVIDPDFDGDINFLSDGTLIFWFSLHANYCRSWRSEYMIHMSDIVTMISFEDKI